MKETLEALYIKAAVLQVLMLSLLLLLSPLQVQPTKQHSSRMSWQLKTEVMMHLSKHEHNSRWVAILLMQ